MLDVPLFVDHLSERLAVDELHRVVMHPTLASDGVDRHDVRVVQERRGLGLGLEPLELTGVEPTGKGQYLERDTPVQRELFGLVNDPHATATDFADDPEIAHDA
jgi:hypothetical protein